jgi:hypothetical protein
MNFQLAIKLGFKLGWRLVWTFFSMFWAISFILVFMYNVSSDTIQGWILLMVVMSALLVTWLAAYNVLAKMAHRWPELFRRVYMPLLLGRNVSKEETGLVCADWKAVNSLFLIMLLQSLVPGIRPSNQFIGFLFDLLIITVFVARILQRGYKKYPGLVDTTTINVLLTERNKKWRIQFFVDLCGPVIYAIPVFIIFFALNCIPRPLSPEVKDFFQYKAEVHPEENGFYAILGLGSNSDPMQAGLQIASQLRAGKDGDLCCLQI